MIRKRVELLIEESCERSPRTYEKRNSEYWENMSEARELKRRRILSEMNEVNDKYLAEVKENKKSPEEMSDLIIKEELKILGKTTGVRKRQTLVDLLHEWRQKL